MADHYQLTSKAVCLKQLGIQQWQHKGSLLVKASAPDVDPLVMQAIDTAYQQEGPANAKLSVVLAEYPGKLAAWTLLDKILQAIGMHRSAVQLLIGENLPADLFVHAQEVWFFADESKKRPVTPSEVTSYHWPTLDTVLEDKQAKQQIWHKIK